MNIPVLNTFSFKLPRGKITKKQLNLLNLWAAGLHGLQGLLVLILSSPDKGVQPITSGFLAQDKLAGSSAGHPVLAPATHTLFDLNLAYLVAAFFFMSAIAHLLVATSYRRRYEADLRKGINKVRWIEYSFSAGTMMVGIALLSGVYDFSALMMIFGLVALMNIMGLFTESRNEPGKNVNWADYRAGVLAGILPWLAVVIYILGALIWGGGVPAFVYFIYASLFLLFSSFAVNMLLQYKKAGKWADYLYGERVYIILSFAAKSALAWQIFAGTLR